MQTFKIFVLHVKKGYEDREAHINAMMSRLGLEFEYITDGDIADLTPEVLKQWFDADSPLGHAVASTSCAYKHIITYQKIIEQGLDGAMILEDDILLRHDFCRIAEESLRQLPPDRPAIINYEDTRLRFVPYSQRRRGRVIYPGDRDRFTGAYYINRTGAHDILELAAREKISRPIDHHHRHLLERGLLDYWWSHPCVATQGSFNGLFASSISVSRSKVLAFKIKKAYRKLLYRFI
ncbi:MAG: glycosyltransferase family 25 protein [Muribaculaceae bacterium]|nr:glycosyltransferase family 25 protein [Muribaculaceae bacterium]